MTTACIIGVSGFGATHYHDLMAEVEAGRTRVLGATVINQDEEAAKCAHLESLGCALFTDHRRMLARFRNRFDLCLVPTGIPLHAPMSIDAMRAGANVLVEKPVAATVQEVQAMASTETVTGRFTAVAYQYLYAAETLAMKRLLTGGAWAPCAASSSGGCGRGRTATTRATAGPASGSAPAGCWTARSPAPSRTS